MTESHHVPVSKESRPYFCTDCKVIVHSFWTEPGGFSVGCDCTTVPVVPQMGQYETPDNWRVYREECCRDVDVSELETVYGERGEDYECPDCGATYSWDGEMQRAPDRTAGETIEIDDAQETIV